MMTRNNQRNEMYVMVGAKFLKSNTANFLLSRNMLILPKLKYSRSGGPLFQAFRHRIRELPFHLTDIIGLLKWMGETRDQILKHDRTSLQVLSENIATIIEKDSNIKLSTYLTTLADDLLTSYKRSIKAEEPKPELSFLEQMDLVNISLHLECYDS